MTICPTPNLADANPAEEGGQLPVPEPPTIAIVLAAVGSRFVLDNRRRRYVEER